MSLKGIKAGTGVLTIPICFFHECEGLTVTVETRGGDVYRGRASHTEDNFNMHMDSVTITPARGGGAPRTLDKVFIRGATIVLVIVPDILAKSPIFERVRNAAAGKVVAKGLGVGRLMAMQAKCASRARAPARRVPAPLAHLPAPTPCPRFFAAERDSGGPAGRGGPGGPPPPPHFMPPPFGMHPPPHFFPPGAPGGFPPGFAPPPPGFAPPPPVFPPGFAPPGFPPPGFPPPGFAPPPGMPPQPPQQQQQQQQQPFPGGPPPSVPGRGAINNLPAWAVQKPPQ